MDQPASAAPAGPPAGPDAPNGQRARAPQDHADGDRDGRGSSDSKRDQGGGRSKKRRHKAPGNDKRGQRGAGFRREQNDETQRKKSRREDAPKPIYATEFSKEEIENEARRPKRKVAVLFGYSGSGYKGLQVSNREKTIEGEMFQAFVAAGAISKANAEDPKKSSLVRCARTDKGVHAAGNILSVKLIVDDEPDLASKINEHLSPQIRVWDVMRTNSSFSAYQLCDSRVYEYMIPTHCFLPPHPDTFLGKKLVEYAEEAGDLEGYRERQKEVETFWEDADKNFIKPVTDGLDPEVVEKARKIISEGGVHHFKDELARIRAAELAKRAEATGTTTDTPPSTANGAADDVDMDASSTAAATKPLPADLAALDAGFRALKAAYNRARGAYRISPARLQRVRETLACFAGTHNYHNYTVRKAFSDPSALRVIRSFTVSENSPFITGASEDGSGGTEWLSIKVHGQSFMMHQIRKMVSMCALAVRCGTPAADRVADSFSARTVTIPKAPGLGLLLERPVFDTYNAKHIQRAQPQQLQKGGGGSGDGGGERLPIDFDRYASTIDAFKQREIYERIWREDERDGAFYGLFASIDSLRSAKLLWVTSLGLKATEKSIDGDEWEAQGDAAVEGLGEEEQQADS